MQTILLKTDEQLIIREAQKADASPILQYVKTVGDESNFLTFSGAEFTLSREEEEAVLEAHHLAPNQIYLLAEIEGQIVGVLNVKSSKRKRLEHIGEFGVSVLKKHWNKGIGGHLLRYTVDWAKATGLIRKLNLRVIANNEAAIHLYQKIGFVEEGRVSRDMRIGEQFFDSLLMGLLID